VGDHLEPPEVVAGEGAFVKAIVYIDGAKHRIFTDQRHAKDRFEVELLDRLEIAKAPVVHRVVGTQRLPGVDNVSGNPAAELELRLLDRFTVHVPSGSYLEDIAPGKQEETSLGACYLDHCIHDQPEQIIEHDPGVEVAVDLHELEKDLALGLQNTELIFLIQPFEGLQEVVRRQVNSLICVLLGDMLEKDLRLTNLNAVSRPQLFAKNQDTVDHRTVAALEIDNLKAAFLPLNLAMHPRAADIGNLDRILVRTPDRSYSLADLENGLITVFGYDQLWPLTRTIGALLMWLATHIEEDLPKLKKSRK